MAAYIETLQRQAAPPTVKQHMAAIRMLFSWLTEKGILGMNPTKKELVGGFKNGSRELRLKGDPEQVRVHDFVIPELGRVTPYGVYDVGKNRGWVSVGVDHDTAAFAWRASGAGGVRWANPSIARLSAC